MTAKRYNLVKNDYLRVQIADNMNTYGGGFVKALAQCLYRADKLNLSKLEIAFYEYIE